MEIIEAPTYQTESSETKVSKNDLEVKETSAAMGSESENKLESILASKPQPTQKLDRLTLFSMTELLRLGYRISYLKVNRDIDEKEVLKKMKSIRNASGVISPFLVVPAAECLRQNLEIREANGDAITCDTDDINYILVLVDGQHRFEAVERLKTDSKPMVVERYFFLPLIPDYNIMDLLSEANTATNSWDGIDYLTKFIQIARKNGMNPLKALKYKEIASKPKMSDSAASLWVNGEIVSKAYIIKKMKSVDDGNYADMKKFLETTNLDNRMALYETACSKFNDTLVGLKTMPSTFLRYITGLVNSSMLKMDEAFCYVKDYILNLSLEQAKTIIESQKTVSKTRDQVLVDNLDATWTEYQNKCPIKKQN